MKLLEQFKKGAYLLITDPICLILGFIPLAMAGILYGYVSKWLLISVRENLQTRIQAFFGWDTNSFFLGTFILVILFALTLFLINWTFFLVISVLASPFNDLLSSRIEKLSGVTMPDDMQTTFKSFIRNFFKTILKEFKKVLAIAFLSIFVLCLNLIPLLTPLSILLSGLLVAISFLDYSWSRHAFGLATCIKDLKHSFLNYLFWGCFFLFFLSIPIINVLMIPLGVSTLTIAFIQNTNR